MSFEKISKEFFPLNYDIMRPKGFIENSYSKAEDRFLSVDKRAGFKELTSCPICSCKENSIEFEKFGVNILKCEQCSVRYIQKVPNNVEDVYSDDKYLENTKSNIFNEGQDKYRKERFGEERYQLINSFIDKTEGTSILDVGCGTGWFLELMREKGMDIYGIELGLSLNRWTSQRLNIEIYQEELENTPLNKYDVITMFDLIEHVKDPVKLLLETKKRLKPGGIAVVFTPNFDSFAISEMKNKSSLITPVEHLFYFTKESIEKLSETVGLKISFFETKGTDMLDMKAFYEYQNRQIEANLIMEIGDKLQAIIDNSNCANHMRIIFKNED